MNKLLVTVFDDQSSAFEGIKALRELHAEGSVTLYAAAVISKGLEGAVSVKQLNADQTSDSVEENRIMCKHVQSRTPADWQLSRLVRRWRNET